MAIFDGLTAVGGTASWGEPSRNGILISFTLQSIGWASGALCLGVFLSSFNSRETWFGSGTAKVVLFGVFALFTAFVVTGAMEWYR